MAGAANTSIRAAARLANGFALDLVKLGGFGRDVMDGLLMAAISQANVAQITRNPELQRCFATLDRPPPDDMRRPVSVSGVANSLRIPFETARRRIANLVDAGIVETTPRGVIIPTAPLNSPIYRMGAVANYELVRTLYFRLRGIGLLADLPRPSTSAFDSADMPVRLVIRLSCDYLLRLAEPISLYMGDLVTGLILMDVVHANTQHLADGEGGDPNGGWEPDAFVPDDQRRPVRTAMLAERLGIPQETVRRHLQRLLEAGQCERTADGYFVPARVLARPPFVQFMLDNQSHLHRLYSGLTDFGVISEWERDVMAFRGAA